MLPEEKAREKIDRQLKKVGWDIVSREDYIPQSASAVKEALMIVKSLVSQLQNRFHVSAS